MWSLRVLLRKILLCSVWRKTNDETQRQRKEVEDAIQGFFCQNDQYGMSCLKQLFIAPTLHSYHTILNKIFGSTWANLFVSEELGLKLRQSCLPGQDNQTVFLRESNLVVKSCPNFAHQNYPSAWGRVSVLHLSRFWWKVFPIFGLYYKFSWGPKSRTRCPLLLRYKSVTSAQKIPRRYPATQQSPEIPRLQMPR